MGEEQFKSAETEYFRLKGMLASGRITKAQFEQSLRQLAVQDAQGREWILGVDNGKWYVHDGKSWVRADPYRAADSRVHNSPALGSLPGAPNQSNAPKIIAILLGAILVCVCAGAGIWLAVSTGLVRISPARVSTVAPFPTPIIFPLATPIPIPTSVLPLPATIPPPTAVVLPTATLTPSPTPTITPTPTATLRPQGNCSDPNARWENVVDGQTLDPYHAFIGTADGPDFAGYAVEWFRPGNVLHRSITPVVHGVIFVWNTYTVENGEYPVALIVYLKDGTILAPCVVRVIVSR
jgi:hypothetical protein